MHLALFLRGGRLQGVLLCDPNLSAVGCTWCRQAWTPARGGGWDGSPLLGKGRTLLYWCLRWYVSHLKCLIGMICRCGYMSDTCECSLASAWWIGTGQWISIAETPERC